MYTNVNLQIVQNNQQYIGLNGSYPPDFPKNQIPELFLVTESPEPTDPELAVTGYHIELDDSDPENLIYNQVWDTRAKTQQEIDDDLSIAKQAKIASLKAIDLNLRSQNIDYSVNGTTKTYQADKESTEAIQGMLDTFPTETPPGFYWRALDNTNTTPFTRENLAGLANAIGVRALGYFQHRVDKSEEVMACTTIAQVNAIEW